MSSKITWYAECETRSWKRSVLVFESAVIALVGFVIAGTVQFYGDGSALQGPFLVFTLLLAAAFACTVPMVCQANFLCRWQVLALQVGLGCGVGLAPLAGFLILEVQQCPTQPTTVISGEFRSTPTASQEWEQYRS